MHLHQSPQIKLPANFNFEALRGLRKNALELSAFQVQEPEEISAFLKYHMSGSFPATTCCTQCWNNCCNASFTPIPINPTPVYNGDDGDS